MVKIGVCDDDVLAKNLLKTEIALCLAKNNIYHEIYDYSNANDFLKGQGDFDIIFLDIDMPEINGIELGKRIRACNKQVKIIYVTGYQEYVFAAYDVHAFYYLLKPVNKKMIAEKLLEALSYIKEEPDQKLALKTTEGTVFASAMDIYYFEFYQRKIKVVTEDKEYFISGTLSDLLLKVKPYGFAMNHKAFIVNLQHIRKIISYKIHLSNQMILPLAEKKSAEFRDLYNDYLQELADAL